MKKLIYLLFMCLAVSSLSAQDIPISDFIAQIQEANTSVLSIESDFVQIQRFSFLDEVIESTGNFYFKKPNAMKWEQETPEPYAFVLNDRNAYSYDGVEKKSMPANSPQLLGFRKFIMGTIDGSVFAGDDFETTIVQVSGQIKVEMLPKKKVLKRIFVKIEMTFDQSTLDLMILKFYESEEDTRLISFSNHQKNTLTDYSIFQ